MVIYAGIILLLIIAAVELNPKRYKGTGKFKNYDKLTGLFITTTTLGSILVTVLDNYFHFSTFTSGKPFIEYFALILLISAFIFRNLALHSLGSNFSYSIAPLNDNLNTRGLYKFIRHPAYIGSCLYPVSFSLLIGSYAGLIFSIFVIASIIYRINLEEKFLLKNSDGKYSEYTKKTWRMIPYIY